MELNMFYTVKNHWEPYFTNNPHVYVYMYIYSLHTYFNNYLHKRCLFFYFFAKQVKN